MAPSSNKSVAPTAGARPLGVWLDRVALGGLGVGLAGMVMPVWADGRLKWAFWLTLLSTVLHVFTSHRGSPASGEPR